MPRRQTREIPRWRRGRSPAFAPQPQVVQVRGRKAIEMMRQLEIQQAGQAGRAPNPAAATNDMLARTGAWRRRRQMPPVAWGAGLAVIGEILHTTRNPVLFGILGGLGAAALLILCTRHLSGFGRRWFDAAAFLTLGWLPALAAFGFGAPVPALLAITVTAASGAWIKHYRARPQEPQPEPEPEVTGDRAIWERLAAKRRWVGTLGDREDFPGGRKYEIRLDGVETHIGQVMNEPRALASAFDRSRTEVYAEPHPTAVESRGILTILKSGTLEHLREWDGSGFGENGIARIGRFADGKPVRIRAWVPKDGARHGLIAGTSGAGKSELLNLLLWLAITSEVPVVPVILDPQNGQSLPQWKGKVPYASGIQECVRMVRGLNAGMMDRSRRLASMTWDDDGHKAKGMEFFDARMTGLPIVMAIIDEAPLLLGGDGNAKLAAEMARLTADDAKLGRKAGVSKWLVTQVPSLAELGGDQALRSMLVGGNVVSLRTGDAVSAGMVGLQADPAALPKYFPDGEPTQGIGYAVTLDNRQAPMRTDIVPSRMRHRAVEVPHLEDEFLEAMDRAMRGGGVLLPSAAPAPASAAQPDVPADDGPEGRRCIDAVWTVLKGAGREMERAEIIDMAGRLVTGEWGRDMPYGIRSITNALSDLVSGKHPDRPVIKPRDGRYEALAPRGESTPTDHAPEGA
jgi:hypothetical protein